MVNTQISIKKNIGLEKLSFVENNPSKKNILITISQIETREYTYGYVFPLAKVLEEMYNVYYLYEGGKKTINEYGLTNVYRLNKGAYNLFKDPKSGNLYRKKEREDSDLYNQSVINSAISDFFENEPKFSAIIVIDNHNLMLPFSPLSSHPKLRNLFNDYFDTFEENDPEVIKEVNKLNHKLFDITAKGFSPLAFRYMYKNIMLTTIEMISKMYDAKVHIMIMDPSAAIPFFSYKEINHKFWYFTNDHRHLRNLNASPISELQHLVYEPHWKKILPDKKNLLEEFENTQEKIPFFFAGSLLNDKGLRKYIWDEFFRDFSYDNAKLFFKLNLIYGMDKKTFEELGQAVSSHSNFCGNFMPNDEYINTLKKCKTAFIARNVSANGGLTYRHIQYLYFGVLPIFDYLYDPDYLWIPKKFQDKITVKNSKNLQERVKFFDTNEKERLKILKEMQEYYDISGWVNNWQEKLKQTNLIQELWK